MSITNDASQLSAASLEAEICVVAGGGRSQSVHGSRGARSAAERATMFRVCAPLLVLLLAGIAESIMDDLYLCDSLKFCECARSEHPSWNTVKCILDPQQQISLKEGDLPRSTMKLSVFGGKGVKFEANSLSRLNGLQAMEFHDTQSVIIKTHASVAQNLSSLVINSTDCNLFQMESETFLNLRGPVSVSVENCAFVTIGRKAFSWLLALNVRNVGKLQLVPSAFTLDQTADNIGDHGPGMTIELTNLELDKIPSQGFTASAGLIRLEDVVVDTVSSDAFVANTYNIVLAINTRFNTIDPSAFTQNSLVHTLQFYNCTLHNFSNNALQSAIGTLNLAHNRFNKVGTGAINSTVATVNLKGNQFKVFDEKGFVFASSSRYFIDRNSFDYLPPFAIIAPGSTPLEFTFINNEIETMYEESLPIIGQAFAALSNKVLYANNYYGMKCHCNFTNFLTKATISKYERALETGSFCMIDDIFSRCFNVPEQNIEVSQFNIRVCTDEKNDIKCEAYRSKNDGKIVEIKNPRFPHKHDGEGGLTDRDKKVIGIVIVTALGCVVIVMIITLIRWMRRRGHCASIKNFFFFCNSSCGSLCERACGLNNGIDNARSISRLSVHEYSERHRLNEPRVHEMVQEIALPNIYTEELVRVDEKTTQTMPQALTKELLENLKEKLDDPDNYAEAREMIEHLYELIKVEEESAENERTYAIEENIYELPYQHTMPRIGRNMKKMISVGTRTPSLDKLLPLSPYNRQTALAHEYFQPKDFAVHLYAEIANCTSNMALLGAIPDVLAVQPVPRGPYLRAVRDKMNAGSGAGPSNRPSIAVITNPQNMSTIKSTTSNSSAKMLNRPLPEKPDEVQDPGEGTSRG